MRPRKKILVCCDDEGELSRFGYMLWVRKYAVTSASNLAEALEHGVAVESFDCVVASVLTADEPNAQDFGRLCGRLSGVPSLLVIRNGPLAVSDATAVRQGDDTVGIIDILRLLCARKCGPKKRVDRKPVSEWVGVSSQLGRIG